MSSVLNDKGICTQRFNSDKKINNNGRSLINVCQEFGIRIVNGRFGNDAHKGDITCYSKNEGPVSPGNGQ